MFTANRRIIRRGSYPEIVHLKLPERSSPPIWSNPSAHLIHQIHPIHWPILFAASRYSLSESEISANPNLIICPPFKLTANFNLAHWSSCQPELIKLTEHHQSNCESKFTKIVGETGIDFGSFVWFRRTIWSAVQSNPNKFRESQCRRCIGRRTTSRNLRKWNRRQQWD